MNAAIIVSAHPIGSHRIRSARAPHGVDRLARDLGLALVAWSRRSERPVDREAMRERWEHDEVRRAALEERERAVLMLQPRR
ncbi:hypothetical protein QT381_01510 [Galbitalea sp. SE-J8]|uniref:hypothetical protein n=1 Tax=Galbitalea sp. SE-J8 TaxID=3054952 RepID=UPI00259D0A8D|nr:hypothetical protein [Galbitalea sp. SE-J8]MDM4761681.1 hypothetical protein [Galbitalea sp. SE-J8]